MSPHRNPQPSRLCPRPPPSDRRDELLVLGGGHRAALRSTQGRPPVLGARAHCHPAPQPEPAPGLRSSRSPARSQGLAPPAAGTRGRAGPFLEEGAQGRGDLTQLPSVRSWRAELRRPGRSSVGGVWPENRGPPLRPAIASPAPGSGKGAVYSRGGRKNSASSGKPRPGEGVFKDASEYARWKPMLPGRPLRAGRDCEPLLRLRRRFFSSVRQSPHSRSQSIQILRGIQGGQPSSA